MTSSVQLERVALARTEVGQTAVSPATAYVLLVVFLVMITGGPLAQIGAGLLATSPSMSTSPVTPTNDKRQTTRGRGWSLFTANRQLLARINQLSDRLEHENCLAKAIRPHAQNLLTMLGAGTEQVWQGRAGWLFFKPDVDHVTGPGFLGERQLARRAALGDTITAPPQPDPRSAILTFAEELAERDIELIVVPTPVKPSVHPEQLSRLASRNDWIDNPSRQGFLSELREAGVLVFDPAPVMFELKRRSNTPLYLATDTHWRPETMQVIARQLGAFVSEQVDLPNVESPGYEVVETEVSNTGDIAELLDLSGTGTAYPPERVEIRSIMTSSGESWRADGSADVLVLGDSFSNVFSLGVMGWGESGGLVEQLSYVLERPIDRLTRNDGGAFTSRQMLADELRRGRDRLAGKRVVIYQFAERELSRGDWKLIDLGEAPSGTSTFLVPAGEEIVVRGILADLASPPRPGTVPYKDHIVALHLTEVVLEEGIAAGDHALVYMWSMRDNVLTPVATFQPGRTVRLRMIPWSEVADELDRINRAELEDDAIRLAQPWWAESEPAGQE